MISTAAATASFTSYSGTVYQLNVLGGSFTLDEGNAPYVTATLRVSVPSTAALNSLDPTARIRVVTTLVVNGVTRTFDLLLTDRSTDYVAGELTLTLCSDEQLLMDYAGTGLDIRAYRQTGSIYNVVTVALSSIGASISTTPGTPSVPVPTFLPTHKNLFLNASFETDVSEWTPFNCTTFQSSVYSAVGTKSMLLTPNTASNNSFAYTDPGMEDGKSYRVSGQVRTQALAGSVYPYAATLAVYATVNGVERFIAATTQANPAVSGIYNVSLEFTIPVGATGSRIRAYNGASTGNGLVYWDALMLSEYSLEAPPTSGGVRVSEAFFDGDTANGTNGYNYTWDGTARDSTSTKTPIVERTIEILDWTPGTSGYEWLQVILQALGYRMFCDENRVWKLAGPSWVIDNTTVTVSTGENLYNGSDLLSSTATDSDGSPMWADAVQIIYTWTDAKGVQQTRTDISAPSGFTKLYTIEKDGTPYPGAGAANYVRLRLARKARQQTITSRLDLNATPTRKLAVTAPFTGTITSSISAVTFDLDADQMTITTKALP